MIVRGLKAVDRRAGRTHPVRFAMRYVFPDHWSFLWGEIALYCFVMLVATGVYLTFWFDPSRHQVVYQGSYGPLRGAEMSQAYRSTVDLSLDNPFGLLMRQTHHWAALVFLAAIVMHLMRIFFTGAFRRPRELNWLIGLVMLMTALLEGFAGYSLPDDLPSGMGLAIAYAVVLSIPLLGGPLGYLLWDGAFPGGNAFESRLYTAHVLADPGADRRADRDPPRVRGDAPAHPVSRAAPHRAKRRGHAAVAGVRAALGRAVLRRRRRAAAAGRTRPDQPDLAVRPVRAGARHQRRAARLVPRLADRRAADDAELGAQRLRLHDPQPVLRRCGCSPRWRSACCSPGPGSSASPPAIARTTTCSTARTTRPWRTACGAAFFTWVLVPFVAGSADRVFVGLDIPYEGQILVLRLLWLLLPAVVFGDHPALDAGRPPPRACARALTRSGTALTR